jgi:hypothetical protein
MAHTVACGALWSHGGDQRDRILQGENALATDRFNPGVA